MTRLALILLLILFSCASNRLVPESYENQLRITKQYYGQVCYCIKKEKTTVVILGFGSVELVGNVIVPEGVPGYVRTEPCYWEVHPDIRARLERKYFSWNGSKEYKIKTW